MPAAKPWTRAAVPQILLLGAGLLAYANALDGPFVYDDQLAIVQNASLRSLWPPWGALWPERFTPLAGRPVANLSFALGHAAFGLDVRGHHATNIALHLCSGLALFGLLRRTLRLARLRERWTDAADGIALASAALWLLHPLHTESVDYLTQRTGLLAGLFVLLTAYCAVRSLENAGRRRWTSLSILCCALGIASKESAAVAPLLVLLLHACASGRTALQQSRGLYAGLAATWLLALGILATGPRADTVGWGLGVSAYDYLLNQCDVLVQYLQLAVWPHPLAFDYGVPRARTLADVWPQALLLSGLAAGSGWLLLRRPLLGLLGCWFFVTLAPTSSLLPIVTEVGAERRMYLPLAPLCVAAVFGAALLLRRAPRGFASSLAAAAACALLLTTRARNLDYSDSIRLWASAAEARPANPRAHVNLAVELIAAGRVGEAEPALRRALAVAPNDVLAHYNLALVLRARGERPAARRSLVEALRLAEQGGHAGLAGRIRQELRR